MSNITHLGWCLALTSAVMTSGCDARPRTTYHSPRRILALEFRPPSPPPIITKFLLDTNNDEPDFVNGPFGGFRGGMSVISLSSNATTWRVQLTFNGTFDGSGLRQTNELEVAYPQSRMLSLSRIGSVTGWFLSDEELLSYDKRK